MGTKGVQFAHYRAHTGSATARDPLNWLFTQIESITVLFESKRFDDGYVKHPNIKRPFTADTIEWLDVLDVMVRVSETGVLVLSVKSVKSTSTKSDSQIMGTFFWMIYWAFSIFGYKYLYFLHKIERIISFENSGLSAGGLQKSNACTVWHLHIIQYRV